MTQKPSIAVNFKRRGNHNPERVRESEINAFLVTFKGKPGSVDEVIDLSDVASKRPELAGAFCYYLETACNRGVGSTRKQVVKYFRAFNSFLDVYEATFGIATATLSDLSSVIVRGYADWLDGSDIVMSTLKLTNITKNNRYNALKRFIRHCQRSEIYRERISQTISFRTAWKARRRPSTSARSLTIVHLQALRRECRTRISATRQELEQSAHIIADPSITVPDLSCKSPAPFAFPPVQLKAAAHAFQVNRLSDDFRDAMPGLARTLRMRIPLKPATDSETKPAICSDFIPASIPI